MACWAGRALLLHDVRELMRDQLVAGVAARVESVLAERDVAADGERVRIQRTRQRVGVAAGVDLHPAEVGVKRRFHPAAQSGLERRAGVGLQHALEIQRQTGVC
jgi:hypothetical protein